MSAPGIRRGDVVTLAVEAAAFEGRGVARLENLVVFVEGAVPGDTVRAVVYRTKKQHAEARAVELLEASPLRVEPACTHFGVCGGCSWQHLRYEAQCDWKRTHVRDAFERIAAFTDLPLRDTLPSPLQFHYRNKMEYSFGEKRWFVRGDESPLEMAPLDEAALREVTLREMMPDEEQPDAASPAETSPAETSPDETSPDETSPDETSPDETSPDETSPDAAPSGEPLFALGLHVPQRYDKILPIDACHLQSDESNAILAATRAFFLAEGIPAYSTRTREGDLRHLVIREGKRSGDRMVFLVSSARRPELLERYAAMLAGDPRCAVTTVVHGVTTRPAMVADAEEKIVYLGDGKIRERLGGLTYTISPTSFFQTNTVQAERLYDTVLAAAGIGAGDTVWDLYCGAGTIALHVARHARSVLGVELHQPAIDDARENARANGVHNASFLGADIADFLREQRALAGDAPSVIILDPPRAGLHPSVAEAVGRSGCPRVVYVSCNPATCARDSAVLAAHGYQLDSLTPVDMFPHTYHIECVAAFHLDYLQ